MSQHLAGISRLLLNLSNFSNGAGYFEMAQIIFQVAQNLRHLRPYIWLWFGRSGINSKLWFICHETSRWVLRNGGWGQVHDNKLCLQILVYELYIQIFNFLYLSKFKLILGRIG